MQSILITGAALKKRKKEADKILSVLRVSSLDRIYLIPDKSISIDQVRALIRGLHRKPAAGERKAGLILEAEKLTLEAQNALLKLLEEPPKTAVLILTAPNPKHLLPTIVSRCRLIKLSATPELDEKTSAEIKRVFDTLETLPENRVGERFKLAEEHAGTREDADRFLQNALLYTHNKIRSSAIHGTSASRDSIDNAKRAKQLNLARRFLSANVNPRQVLENLFLSL